MAIAMTVRNYLDQHDIDYNIVFHPKSHGNLHSAKLAHVPPDCVAKPVILEDDDGYVMAVIPASRHVQLGALSQELKRPLRLAMEHEIGKLFRDCHLGAVPPIGTAYGLSRSRSGGYPRHRHRLLLRRRDAPAAGTRGGSVAEPVSLHCRRCGGGFPPHHTTTLRSARPGLEKREAVCIGLAFIAHWRPSRN